MQRVRGQSGFTLIEIMVVVFILGLLVTLVAPKIIGRTDEARRTKALADIKAIEESLNLFKLDNGFYPSTGQGLQGLGISEHPVHVQDEPSARAQRPHGRHSSRTART